MSHDERIAALERRVAALEEQRHAPVETEAGSGADGTLWALDGLRSRLPEPGGVLMAGSVQTPNGANARWQMAAPAEAFFDSDFAERAEALSALGHPARLRIVQRLMSDADTVQDLVGTGEFGTSGQIYHHIKQLTAAGWLRSVGGGRYEVPAARVVPLLTTLLAVDR
ncbi:helix-turn-helix transcriptional regulator [Nesterenkonia sp. NBAIMH1]|uniref:ArsR/SmtB family transcription factor n=1 Tax=Nesterenkonia sp. NBAIMH1 TaxID=2600320 RepID=UPI0011B79630|nr:helix-turn-helix domain-containing protein [Nesterenkonia sp. NBAIMH1]